MRSDVVENAAKRWPDDRAGLPCGRAQRDCAWQKRARDKVRRERAEGGPCKGTRHAKHHSDREQDRQVDLTAPRRGKQDQRAQQLEAEHGSRNVATIEAICRPAAERCQQEQRQKLEQTDQAELESGVATVSSAGDIVYLPHDVTIAIGQGATRRATNKRETP